METFLILYDTEIDAPADDQEGLILDLASGRIGRSHLVPDRSVMRSRKTTHHLLDIGHYRTPPHDTRPEFKRRRRKKRIGESNRRQVVM